MSGAGSFGPRAGGAGSSTSLLADVLAKAHDHQCYSAEAHPHFARIHVAMALDCNIQCNYCNRKYTCGNESRPSVVSENLIPRVPAQHALCAHQSPVAPSQ